MQKTDISDEPKPFVGGPLQEATQDEILKGKQSRLPFSKKCQEEEAKKKEAEDREARRKSDTVFKNFYAIDIETNNLDKPEPLQIAIVLFQDGRMVNSWNKYFESKFPSTHSALLTHGLTTEKLKELGARRFRSRHAQMTHEILN